MKIAVEGCAHGELEKIYETIQELEKRDNIKVDMLLCCGDFQSTRNMEDLQTMAVSQKYQNICTFYKYYTGELKAPMLTIFIGGNHEASNYLQELPYGGWVAPNIYYLGYAGVVKVNGIRIAGVSGIYKGHDYLKGRFEFSPYTESTKRSVYHVRQLEVFRLKQLSGKVDIFLSHDWPKGIYNFGNKKQLARFKPFLRDEMDNDTLGSRPCEDLLNMLRPQYWFAAHLHCKFAAIVQHSDSLQGEEKVDSNKEFIRDDNTEDEFLRGSFTKFLALDKCLPQRRFLQILDINSENFTDDEGDLKFEYDLEWLTILYLTNHLVNVKESYYYLPNNKSSTGERFDFTPTEEEMVQVRKKFEHDLKIPHNFCRTVEAFDPGTYRKGQQYSQPKSQINPQSLQFCDTLGIDDPLSLAMLIGGHELSHSSTLDNTRDSGLNDSSLIQDDQQPSSPNTSTSSNCLVTSSSPLKRKSNSGLNLPKPKTPGEETQLLNRDKSDVEKPEGEIEKNSTTCSIIDTEEMLKEHVNSPKQLMKKFKRRNETIYKPEEESEETL